MELALWIVSGVLAFTFLAAGAMKLSQPVDKLASSGMGWVHDVQPGTVKIIGALEVAGAVGLILPALLGIVPVLTPLAALGLAAVMVGAVIVHARRRELPMVAVNVVLLALALFVAWGRFTG